MIKRLYLTCMAVVAGALLVPAITLAQGDGHESCTNATLRGDYGFRISGNILNESGAPVMNREGVAMTHFDGKGGLRLVDFVMVNGLAQEAPAHPVTGFHTGEHGKYTVNSDCTGSAAIHFPAPPGVSSGAELELMFVLSNHGRTIHTFVTKLIPPG